MGREEKNNVGKLHSRHKSYYFIQLSCHWAELSPVTGLPPHRTISTSLPVFPSMSIHPGRAHWGPTVHDSCEVRTKTCKGRGVNLGSGVERVGAKRKSGNQQGQPTQLKDYVQPLTRIMTPASTGLEPATKVRTRDGLDSAVIDSINALIYPVPRLARGKADCLFIFH